MSDPVVYPPQLPSGYLALWFAIFYGGIRSVEFCTKFITDRRKARKEQKIEDRENESKLLNWQNAFTAQALERIDQLEAREIQRDKEHREEVRQLIERHMQETAGIRSDLESARRDLSQAFTTIASLNGTIATMNQRLGDLEKENLTFQRDALKAKTLAAAFPEPSESREPGSALTPAITVGLGTS